MAKTIDEVREEQRKLMIKKAKLQAERQRVQKELRNLEALDFQAVIGGSLIRDTTIGR